MNGASGPTSIPGMQGSGLPPPNRPPPLIQQGLLNIHILDYLRMYGFGNIAKSFVEEAFPKEPQPLGQPNFLVEYWPHYLADISQAHRKPSQPMMQPYMDHRNLRGSGNNVGNAGQMPMGPGGPYAPNQPMMQGASPTLGAPGGPQMQPNPMYNPNQGMPMRQSLPGMPNMPPTMHAIQQGQGYPAPPNQFPMPDTPKGYYGAPSLPSKANIGPSPYANMPPQSPSGMYAQGPNPRGYPQSPGAPHLGYPPNPMGPNGPAPTTPGGVSTPGGYPQGPPPMGPQTPGSAPATPAGLASGLLGAQANVPAAPATDPSSTPPAATAPPPAAAKKGKSAEKAAKATTTKRTAAKAKETAAAKNTAPMKATAAINANPAVNPQAISTAPANPPPPSPTAPGPASLPKDLGSVMPISLPMRNITPPQDPQNPMYPPGMQQRPPPWGYAHPGMNPNMGPMGPGHMNPGMNPAHHNVNPASGNPGMHPMNPNAMNASMSPPNVPPNMLGPGGPQSGLPVGVPPKLQHLPNQNPNAMFNPPHLLPSHTNPPHPQLQRPPFPPGAGNGPMMGHMGPQQYPLSASGGAVPGMHPQGGPMGYGNNPAPPRAPSPANSAMDSFPPPGGFRGEHSNDGHENGSLFNDGDGLDAGFGENDSGLFDTGYSGHPSSKINGAGMHGSLDTHMDDYDSLMGGQGASIRKRKLPTDGFDSMNGNEYAPEHRPMPMPYSHTGAPNGMVSGSIIIHSQLPNGMHPSSGMMGPGHGPEMMKMDPSIPNGANPGYYGNMNTGMVSNVNNGAEDASMGGLLDLSDEGPSTGGGNTGGAVDMQKVNSLVHSGEGEGSSADFGESLSPPFTPILFKTVTGHTTKVFCCAFDMSGKYLATGGGGMDAHIRIWEVETGNLHLLLKGHNHNITALRWSTNPASPYCLLSCSMDKDIRLWNVANPDTPELDVVRHNQTIVSLDWHPTSPNQFICTDHMENLLVWYLKDSMGIESSPASTIPKIGNKQVRYSPNARFIAVGYFPNTAGSIKILDGERHTTIQELTGHEKQILSVSWIDDSLVVSASEDCVRVWKFNGASFDCLRQLKVPGDKTFYAIPHPKAPSRILVGTYQLLFDWDYVADQRRSHTAHEGIVSCLAYSPPSDVLASASHDRTVKLWKLG